MRSQLITRRMLLPGLAYAAAAALSIGLTRASGGIAMFWIATAVSVPMLLATPIRSWWMTLAAIWLASTVTTGLLGFGWAAAPLLALANCAELAIVALALRAAHRRFHSYMSLRWLGWTILTGALIAPLASGLLALAVLGWLTDLDWVTILRDWTLSHGLGFLCIFPSAGIIANTYMRGRALLPEPGKRWVAAVSLLAIIAAGTVCFGQSTVPMLFLPILVLMYVMVVADLAVSAVALVILVTMGIASAFLNVGPLNLMSSLSGSSRFLYLQFYIVCIALTAMPIAIVLARRRKLFAALLESEARYRLLADFSTDIIMVTAASGEMRYLSPSVRQLGGYEPDQLVGTSGRGFIAPQHRALVAEASKRVSANPGITATVEFLGVTKSSGTRWFEAHMRGIFREDGSPDGVCSTVRDISKRKRRESELEAVSLTDRLTGLANRSGFDVVMASLVTEGESYVALFDLGPAIVRSDAAGRADADILLQAFARAARGVLREGDLIARIDEARFAVHLHDTALTQVELVCERIRGAFAHEALLTAPDIAVSAIAVGISRSGGTADEMLHRATGALRRAQADGEGGLAIAA